MDLLIPLHGRRWLSLDAADTVRKPIGPEHSTFITWVANTFTPRWASEATVALANRPVTLFLAARAGDPLGFCCYDATARGYIGPIGVAPAARGTGLGAVLLRACLHDMRLAGYGYAIVGGVAGAEGFFHRVAGAVEIPDSTPGLYADLLLDPPPPPE